MSADLTTTESLESCHAARAANPPLTNRVIASSSQRLRSVANTIVAPSAPEASADDESESRYEELFAGPRREMIRSCAAKNEFPFEIADRPTHPTSRR